MTANLRTSIKQKITPFIKSFVASDMYELNSTINVNGQQVSRFRLFLNALGVDDKTQDETKELYADTKREIYGGIITDFIKANSEAMTKGTKKDPPKKKEDNIGRRKLFEIMKKYILVNPNDPRFSLSQQTQESKEPEVKEPQPQLVDGPELAKVDEEDDEDLPEDDLKGYFGSAEEKQDKLRAVIERSQKQKAMDRLKQYTNEKKAEEKQIKLKSAIEKSFGISERQNAMDRLKQYTNEKKKETKAQRRKTVANQIKLYKKQLDDEAIAEAKAIAQSKREEKARKAQEKKSISRLGTSDILRAQQATQPQRVPEKAPEEKKQTVFNMGLSDLLAAAPAPPVATRVPPPFVVIPPLVSTPAPAPAPQAEAVLEQPQEVKQRPRTGNLKLRGVINRAQQRDRKKQQELTMRNFKSNRQPIQEKELELDQVGLDADAEVQTQQQRERMLEKQLEQVQQIGEQPQRVSMTEKEKEVKLPPARTRMSDYLLEQLGGATFSALSSVLATRARRTGDSELGGYTAMFGGLLGSAVYNSAMRLYPDIFNDIISEVNEYFGISPQDIIKEARATPPEGPQPPQGPQRIEDIKGEGRYDPSQPPRDVYSADLKAGTYDFLDSKATPEQIDNFRISQGLPPVNRGAMARLRGLGGAGKAYVADTIARKYNEVKSSLDPQVYDEQGRPTKYDIRGNLIKPEDPNEEVFLDRNTYADAKDFEGSRPSRIREAIDRSKRVLRSTLDGVGDIDPLDMNDREQQLMNDVRTRNAIIGGSAIGGAGLVGAGIASSFNKQQPRIKEDPLIFKHEQTTQGDGETNIDRGAGKLKPKFIVPSANIFNKTEQEQYVDDIEFAMFDFVQDEGGNDPYGTNPLLRDQQITDGLRYQRSGVNVYSLYGANLPDNPKNMPLKKMNEMFLGENRLPEMKFLFSNEFEGQEFNQSEFEVDEYDVNNDRIAIEAYSPYANFTNNQLLDQFYDTSILYGVVP